MNPLIPVLQKITDVTPDAADFALDGRAPITVAQPQSEAEAAEVVRAAEARGAAVVPWGGGTQMETDNPLRADGFVALSTARINGLIDYQPADLVVTCAAGMTLAALQELLAESGQRLALDVALPERATLGGIVAANALSLWRPLYGGPRDLLLGARMVMTGGEIVKAGGRVVKNVAGYDLCKLFTGSWGTLGVLTELTFKVSPKPPAEETLTFAAPDTPTAANAALALMAARVPVAFAVVSDANPADTASGQSARLSVGFHGQPEAVPWLIQETRRIMAETGLHPFTPSPPIRAGFHPFTPSSSDAPLIARIACPPADAPQTLARIYEQANRARAGATVIAHPFTGTIFALFAGENADWPGLTRALPTALPGEGYVTWPRLPRALRGVVDAWGGPRADFALHQGMKRTLDPKDTFSPGRFIVDSSLRSE